MTMASSSQPFGSNNPFRRDVPSSGQPTDAAGPILPPSAPFNSSPAPSRGSPAPSAFKSAFSQDASRIGDGDSVQVKPKKIVKKVRVQSPPPSSPEDSIPVTGFAAGKGHSYSDDEDSYNSDDSVDHTRGEAIDPFRNVPPTLVGDSGLPGTSENPTSRFAMNPFAGKTSAGSDVGPDDATAKGTMDVDAFKRLLLTGHGKASQSSRDGPAEESSQIPSTKPTQDGENSASAHAAKKQSILDAMKETARSSSYAPSPAPTPGFQTQQSQRPVSFQGHGGTSKKPPPPPSSRHGKLIKVELGSEEKPSSATNIEEPPSASPDSASSPSAESNVNKPLPLPPNRGLGEEEAESPFDREAAGKVPEAFAELQAHPRPPTPPPSTRARSGSQGSNHSRRSVAPPVAPPPRRHARAESKAQVAVTPNQTSSEEDPPRSSLDSSRSRTDSLRVNTSAAPAPPPPRRPQHSRSNSSYAGHTPISNSPSPATNDRDASAAGLGFTPVTPNTHATDGTSNLATVTTGKDGQPRISPPPPPPARNSSTRRPQSMMGTDASGQRKTSREKSSVPGGTVPPPPPPRPPPSRRRGNSNGSVDRPMADGGSAVGASPLANMHTAETTNELPTSTGAPPTMPGAEILADLDALQREVDALRNQYGTPPQAPPTG